MGPVSLHAWNDFLCNFHFIYVHSAVQYVLISMLWRCSSDKLFFFLVVTGWNLFTEKEEAQAIYDVRHLCNLWLQAWRMNVDEKYDPLTQSDQ